MLETAILVLLYNKEITESKTIKSFKNSKLHYHNSRIVIWNNGPKKINRYICKQLMSLGYDVQFKETLNNESLGFIYNRFITQNMALKYIILDDDSVLSEEYISASLKSKSTDICFPIISSNGAIHSPTIDEKPYTNRSIVLPKSKIIAIGSGLVIGSVIADKVKKIYDNIFDERFYLYGVDTTFCLRVYDCGLIDKVKIIPGFDHSLSRLSHEDAETQKFRRLERSYDLGLQLKYYYPLAKALYLIFLVGAVTLKRQLLRQPSSIEFLSTIKAYKLGRHYRSKD